TADRSLMGRFARRRLSDWPTTRCSNYLRATYALDVAVAMVDGYSTAGGLGNGLPGARRLVSEFDVDSARGEGTRVRLVQWRGCRGSLPAPR
ncbi:MAG: hypothetical protein JW751_02085, partial [Polyangiaceae bacterium]|nr:hypothetical protein [Polyangiaceae bacterium]